MNFSSLGFFRSLRRENQQFGVIGLGRFGRGVCTTLYKQGYQVMGTDIDEKRVAQALSDQIISHAIQLDSTEVSALKEGGLFECNTVIVAIGNYLQESIITTLNVKEAGVAYVVAKASSEIHGKLLQKVGADHIVYPEYEAGCALARSITQPSVLDRFDLDPNHSIVEVLVPEEFHGKTVMELQLRSRYGLNVLAVGKNDNFEINPDPTTRLAKGSRMVVIGSTRDIERMPM